MTKPAEGEFLGSRSYGHEARDELVFFREWLRAPFLTAAMLPSGPALSAAIAAAIEPRVRGPVVELGPGTGAVTAALIERGISPERLVLIEFIPEFCKLLQKRYPEARVIQGDAFAAPSIVGEMGLGPLAGIISCLPLYARPPEAREKLMLDLLRIGAPEAVFVQATNFPRSPIPIDVSQISAAPSKRIWRNMFPAVVWSYRLVAGRRS